ncbi:MAG: AzlD domain-containing protein [Acidimicrobiia bacterium]
MNNLPLVLAVAAITFGSRFLFLSRSFSSLRLGRFLDVFAVALFVAIGVQNLMTSGADNASPYLGAFVGAVLGGFLFRRAMLGVVITGLAFYWAARLLI